MSTSVCVCVCVCVCVLRVCVSVRVSVREHISQTTRGTRDLYQIFVPVAWPWLGSPPASLRNPKGKGQFWGFLPH